MKPNHHHVDNPFKSPQVLSVCTGIRGLERGLERALGGAIRVAAFVEIETFIIENLLAGMEAGVVGAAPIWANIKTFPYQQFYRKLHGIIGGYPCQPFSVAGLQKGESDPRHLWPYLERIIRATGPVWCFFENVPGHLSIGYDKVYASLRDMGYTVEAGIFSASEAGAPHERERIFILAIKIEYTRSKMGDSRCIIKGAKSHRFNIRQFSDQKKFESNTRDRPANTSKEVGHPEYDGSLTTTQQGSHRENGKWSTEGAYMPIEPSGADQSRDSRIIPESEKLADAHHNGGAYEFAIVSGAGQSFKKEEQWEIGQDLQRKRVRNEPEFSSEQLADSNSINGRLSKSEKREHHIEITGSSKEVSYPHSYGLRRIDKRWIQSQIERSGKTVSYSSKNRRRDLWPSGPEQPQYKWEESRTIESSMGCTVNGYNFREDLLRAYGNGVVEQTAEIAFRELIIKHGLSHLLE
jgi:site-specific DNA-cytosine methylase